MTLNKRTQKAFTKPRQDQIFAAKAFGGALLGRAHARERRPHRQGATLLITLSADVTGCAKDFSHPSLYRGISMILRRQARAHRTRLTSARIGRDTVQFELRAGRRIQLSNFLRAVSGLIARRALGREKGAGASAKTQKLWRSRPLSAEKPRTLSWKESGPWLHRLLAEMDLSFKTQGSYFFEVPGAFFSSA